MSFPFVPNLIVEKLTQLTPQLLKELGVEFLMLDFDNTIIPYITNEPDEEMAQWLKMMQESDIGICIVSNSKKNRVVEFSKARGIACITHSKKPFGRGIRQCKERFGFDMSHAALAGDQIYTDVLGANCAGAVSILVKPICLHNIWFKLRHVLEKPFIAMGKNRRLK